MIIVAKAALVEVRSTDKNKIKRIRSFTRVLLFKVHFLLLKIRGKKKIKLAVDAVTICGMCLKKPIKRPPLNISE